MRRLATDGRLRAALGAAARRFGSTRFRLEHMLAGYVEAIDAAAVQPPHDAAARARLPAHFLADGTQHVTQALRNLGLPDDRIGALWSTP
jgi:hypothetical protein